MATNPSLTGDAAYFTYYLFLNQASGSLFGGDLLSGGGHGDLLQPMNKQQTQVDQTQTGGDKRDLDSSLNKVAMSIGKFTNFFHTCPYQPLKSTSFLAKLVQ